jgi:hypothetical protein
MVLVWPIAFELIWLMARSLRIREAQDVARAF